MSYRSLLAPGVAAIAIAVCAAAFLSGVFTSQAVQNPSISLDMDTGGNTYSDPGAGGDNSMSVGTTENCSTTAAPGNNNTHTHPVHVVIRDVEDLIGWQIRMNYDGGKMRPATFNFTPFMDSSRGQDVSFVNLPIDSSTSVHRGIIGATNIPAAAPGPQTALAGSNYLATQNAPISPDTPPKAVPDDTSYSAPTGGVVATLNLQVLAGNAGDPSLFMNLDDANPNPPGSKVIVFDGVGLLEINLDPSALGDGYHGEGATCVPLNCVVSECPSGDPTPPPSSPSPTPTAPPPPSPAGHDSKLSRIGSIPHNVRLSSSQDFVGDITDIVVVNQSAHTDTIGVYVEVQAPSAGSCSPAGRVVQTTVTLAAGDRTTVSPFFQYNCLDPSAANGQSFTWVAVVDHGADDLSSCPPGSLQGLTCFNALADDDEDPADNRKSRTGPKVVAQ